MMLFDMISIMIIISFRANHEITEMKSVHKAELAKLEAINRRMQVQVKTLEDSLEQKNREVAELTKICDELITKVSQR